MAASSSLSAVGRSRRHQQVVVIGSSISTVVGRRRKPERGIESGKFAFSGALGDHRTPRSPAHDDLEGLARRQVVLLGVISEATHHVILVRLESVE